MGKMKEFDNVDKFKLVDFIGDENGPYKLLKEADEHIKGLMDNPRGTPSNSDNHYKGVLFKYKNSIQTEWNATIEQLGELQALVLIERITNCDDAIKGLLEAFTAKMTAVNTILKSRLGSTATPTPTATTTATPTATTTATPTATPTATTTASPTATTTASSRTAAASSRTAAASSRTAAASSRTAASPGGNKYYKTKSNAIYDKYIKYKMKYINYKKFINNNN
jgi:hypothetical protein